jgi:bifunctional DNA-binding transcriptional regulator/antitoxin component of YhaV-PrlF toxin-antitoxin module
MRLQKRFNRKVGDKEYSKWIVVLPSDKIEKAGWQEGQELDIDVRDDKLVLRPKKE